MRTVKTTEDASARVSQKVEFSGTAREYFGIWIVNVILSILTLGIYSAWAKVRREIYFKNNTKILDHGFGYHATGKQILKGRLIAAGVLSGLGAIDTFLPFWNVAFIPVFLFLLPWLLNNSMRFAARMASYRNVRFNWHGTYWGTFWFFVVAPSFGILTLGLIAPLISKSYYSYFARSHSYGTTRFTSKPGVSGYYFAFFVGVILPTLLLSCVISILVLLGRGSASIADPGYLLIVLPFVLATLYFFSWSLFYGTLCRNLMMKSLSLSDVATFDSKINPARLIWISLSNLVAIIASIGLLFPWARVRMYSYVAGCTEINIKGDVENFVDEAVASRSSFGEELAEFEGVEAAI